MNSYPVLQFPVLGGSRVHVRENRKLQYGFPYSRHFLLGFIEYPTGVGPAWGGAVPLPQKMLELFMEMLHLGACTFWAEFKFVTVN